MGRETVGYSLRYTPDGWNGSGYNENELVDVTKTMNTAFSGRGFAITTVVENYNGYDLINNVGTGLIGITKSSAINSSHLDMFGNRKYEEVTRYDESGNMGEANELQTDNRT